MSNKTPNYTDELIELSGFNPNQPRDPKGTSTGGQFATGGATGADEPVSVGNTWNGGSGNPGVEHKIPGPSLDDAIKARDAARFKMDANHTGSKKWRDAEDDYHFWSNKVATLDVMTKAGIK